MSFSRKGDTEIDETYKYFRVDVFPILKTNRTIAKKKS